MIIEPILILQTEARHASRIKELFPSASLSLAANRTRQRPSLSFQIELCCEPEKLVPLVQGALKKDWPYGLLFVPELEGMSQPLQEALHRVAALDEDLQILIQGSRPQDLNSPFDERILFVPESWPLSELKILIHKLAQLRGIRRSQERFKMKQTRFFVDYSHRLKTPAQILAGLSDNLLATEKNQKIDLESLRLLQREAHKLNELIQGSDLTKLKPSEATAPKAQLIDLRETLLQLLKLMEPEAKKRGIEIRREIPQKPRWTHADRDRIAQAIIEILLYSFEQATDQSIMVSLANEKEALWIQIKDQGPGNPPEIDPFEPELFRMDQKGSRNLNLAQEILNAHHSGLQVACKPGIGCIYGFALQLAKRQRDP